MSTRSWKLLLVEFCTLALLALMAHSLAPAPQAALAASEWHVCKTGGADFTSIQAAVDAAAPTDVIKVAAGVYTESNGTSNLVITKTVHLLGGYTCADFTNRNITNNVTTIRPSTT